MLAPPPQPQPNPSHTQSLQSRSNRVSRLHLRLRRFCTRRLLLRRQPPGVACVCRTTLRPPSPSLPRSVPSKPTITDYFSDLQCHSPTGPGGGGGTLALFRTTRVTETTTEATTYTNQWGNRKGARAEASAAGSRRHATFATCRSTPPQRAPQAPCTWRGGTYRVWLSSMDRGSPCTRILGLRQQNAVADGAGHTCGGAPSVGEGGGGRRSCNVAKLKQFIRPAEHGLGGQTCVWQGMRDSSRNSPCTTASYPPHSNPELSRTLQHPVHGSGTSPA